MNIVGIVQARMGSRRLPGKMMLDMRGAPIVEWVYRRASRAKRLGRLLFAIPDSPRDDVLERHQAWLRGRGLPRRNGGAACGSATDA